ncbi:HemK/PrmC family methyltransferase [Campylobacter sp.]|uniref:HemK/PrmC family methyltransferase n=1 Tax=Campylobacter sp. TaxID=205 RepID=UPI0026DBBE7C|nr:HemK/PrmC family methyltransferase [Campylobacter sp.]MDO4674174.1 HemK/PrmC family methyltransferase [Campylobacter sp.]
MTIKEALTLAKKRLQEHENEALFILCEHLGRDRTWLFFNENLEFSAREYFALIERFADGEPFEYIFKKASFWGLDFEVEEGVLIPRYDSEILLMQLLEFCRNKKPKNILEIGFGSGILSIILAKELGLEITACDINDKALKIAQQNAIKHKVAHLINFHLSDFKDLRGEFELIFSNPPYIKASYKLDKWTQKEPKNALFGGEDGHEILESIIEFSFQKGVKFLACEMGHDQKKILAQSLQKHNFEAKFFQDERGFDRAFFAHNLLTFSQ